MTIAEGDERVEWVNVRVSSGRHVLLFPSNDGNTMAMCVKASKKPGESYVAAVLRNLWEDVGIAPYRVGAMAIDRAQNVAHVSLHTTDHEPLLVDPLQKSPVWAEVQGLPMRFPDVVRIPENALHAEAKRALEVRRLPVLSMRVGYLLRGAALYLDDPDVLALDGSIATEKLIKLVGEHMTLEELHEIVERSPKRRYRFIEDGKRVVALNGITQAMRDACPNYVVGECLTSQTRTFPSSSTIRRRRPPSPTSSARRRASRRSTACMCTRPGRRCTCPRRRRGPARIAPACASICMMPCAAACVCSARRRACTSSRATSPSSTARRCRGRSWSRRWREVGLGWVAFTGLRLARPGSSSR